MSQKPNIVFPEDEEISEKLKRKSKESPFMIAGKMKCDEIRGKFWKIIKKLFKKLYVFFAYVHLKVFLSIFLRPVTNTNIKMTIKSKKP